MLVDSTVRPVHGEQKSVSDRVLCDVCAPGDIPHLLCRCDNDPREALFHTESGHWHAYDGQRDWAGKTRLLKRIIVPILNT